MSDETTPETGEVLERNLDELLRRAHRPPAISDSARARILARLEAQLIERAARAPARRPEPEPAPEPEPEAPAGWLRRLLFAPRRAALAGALAVGAAAVAGAFLAGGGEGALLPRRHENPGPRAERVDLADGSHLILRAGAAVRERGPRRVELVRGEVLFDVARGEGPFVVSRPGSADRVVVLGTRFVLEGDGAATLAAVIRGRVRLEGRGGSLEIGAGEGGELGRRGPRRRPVERLSHLVPWARAARRRAEGEATEPIRRGNLIARWPGWGGEDYPLPMRRMNVDVLVEDQVARVAIDQTFFNEQPFSLEGIYSFALPAGAAISRLAMYVDGKRVEAGIAERTRARKIYESIVYRRRDPALMEWMAGNQLQVKVFPLPGRQEKRILYSYTQPLERLYDDVSLSIPLPRLDRPVGQLRFHARLVGCAGCQVASSTHDIATRVDGDDLVVSFEARGQRIEDDLLLKVRQPRAAPRVAVAPAPDGRQYLIARIAPDLGDVATAPRRPRRWVVLDDTSGSRRPIERAAQLHVADRLLEELDEGDEVAFAAFDATVRRYDDGRFTRVDQADARAVHRFLERQGVDGVGRTDLAAALAAASKMLRGSRQAGFEPRIILLSDGVVTGGERRHAALARAAGDAVVVAIAVGARHDRAALDALAARSGGMVAVFNPGDDLDWKVFDLVAALDTARVTHLEAELEGGEGGEAGEPVYLSSRQLADGEELVLLSRVGAELPRSIRLSGRRGGAPFSRRIDVDPGAVDRRAGYLPRLWARRRIEALLADEQSDHREEITRLAMRHWLLTPYTSLLVLDSDAAYRRFHVARSSGHGWAAYPAPDKIRVVTEPAGGATDPAAVSRRALIFRDPLELFRVADPGWYAYRYGWGTGRGYGLEASGVGFGGGGRGNLALDQTAVYSSIGGGAKRGMTITSEVVTRDLGDHETSEPEPDQTKAPARHEDSSLAQPVELVVSSDADANREVFRAPRTSAGPQLAGQAVGAFDEHGGLYTAPRSAPIPAVFLSPGDRRFDDLSALLPALYSGPLDRERERLVRAGEPEHRNAVAAAAAERLERARALAGGARYSRGDATLEIDGDGRFRLSRIAVTGLREELDYDGARLITSYPGIDLAVTRQVGDAEPLLLEREAPLLPPSPRALSRFYRLEVGGGGEVVARRQDAGWELVYRFDERGRFASLERRGDGAGELIHVRYRGDEVAVRAAGVERHYRRTRLAAVTPPRSQPSASTVVAMPLRHPGVWRARRSAGGASRSAVTQLLASTAALGRPADLEKTLEGLAGEGVELSRGEVVLASAGLVAAAPPRVARTLAGLDRASPLRRYLAAARRYRRGGGVAALEAVARGDSWPGAVAALRLALYHGSRGELSGFRRQLARLESRLGPELRYTAVWSISQRLAWNKPQAVAALWDRVAGAGRWRVWATLGAAGALARGGRYGRAADRFERAVDLGLAEGIMPPLDYTARSAFVAGPRGQAGWVAFWARLRDRVLASREPALVAGLLRTALFVGQPGDVERLTAAALDLDLGAARRLDLVGRLLASGRRAEAARLFEPLWPGVEDGSDERPEPYAYAATFREQQGRLFDAAALWARGMDRRAGGEPLSQLRAAYGRLLSLYTRAARLGSGGDGARAVAEARRAAADWRALDPDNAAIDRDMSAVLFAVGDAEEAMRYLSTAIERHPMKGSSYDVVARALLDEGRSDMAADLWKRAAELEPENPTWPLDRARALLALGRSGEARAVLAKVVAQKGWHERFAGALRGARALLERLE